jgi:hypothetical protein
MSRACFCPQNPLPLNTTMEAGFFQRKKPLSNQARKLRVDIFGNILKLTGQIFFSYFFGVGKNFAKDTFLIMLKTNSEKISIRTGKR